MRSYRFFILRLWAGEHSGEAGWLASLEEPGKGRPIGFANLEELFVYLMEESRRWLGTR